MPEIETSLNHVGFVRSVIMTTSTKLETDRDAEVSASTKISAIPEL